MNLNVFKKIFFLISLLLILLFLSGCTFEQYIAHYANQYGWRTKLTIRNGNSSDVDVTLEFYDNDGNKVSTAEITIPANGFRTDYVENFFTESLPDTGSLRIVSDEPGFVSKVATIILFEHTDSKGSVCMGGLQGAKRVSKYLSFPWFENSNDFTTGIAILNPNGYDIVATMRANTEDGTLIYSKPIKLKPMQRIIGFPSSFFDESIPDMSTLDVFATGEITGFIIMYDNNIDKAEAISGVENENLAPEYITYQTYVENKTLDGTLCIARLSRDMNTIYVMEYGVGIHVFKKGDLNTPVHTYTFSASFYGRFDVSPDNKRIIVANWYQNKFYEINLEDDSISTFDNLESAWSVAYSKDGNYLAVGSGEGTIVLYEVDLETHTYTPFFSASISGGSISDLIFSNDSKYLLATDFNNKKLYYINLASKTNMTVEDKDLNLDGPESLCVSRGGTYYICGIDNKICKLSSLTSTPTYISLSRTRGAYNIDVSSDGRYLFCAGDESSEITIIDLNKNNEETSINTTGYVTDVVFSPDDLFVYYVGKKLGYLY